MTICKRVLYTGRVQGVGFRYTVNDLAAGFVATGFVRNLPNGNVELVAEGEADQVAALLAAVADRMADYIRQAQEQNQPLGGYKDFTIRH